MTLRIRNLFRSLAELTDYCDRNPDFPATVGLLTPLECWQFNPTIPIS